MRADMSDDWPHVATLASEYTSGPSRSQFAAWCRSCAVLCAEPKASGSARSMRFPRIARADFQFS